MVNFSLLAAEIGPVVWGTRGTNFNGFRVLAALLHVSQVASSQPNFAALNRGRHLCSAGRQSRWALAHILVYAVRTWKVGRLFVSRFLSADNIDRNLSIMSFLGNRQKAARVLVDCEEVSNRFSRKFSQVELSSTTLGLCLALKAESHYAIWFEAGQRPSSNQIA